MAVLTDEQVARFVSDGFVHLADAFPRELAEECRRILWPRIGCAADAPATWTRPVVRLDHLADEPFRAAANTPRLHAAFDQLAGVHRWAPRGGLGTFVVRFPHPDDPGDAGWHCDGGYTVEGDVWPWLNVQSRGRALLMLFLFSDVGPDDAPTRIKVGSHRDVPAFLAPAGERGMSVLALARAMDEAGRLDATDRPLAHATGAAGDVYLCHPFLVHAAQAHRGTRPRILAQPPLAPREPIALERADGAYSPVERAIRDGLASG